MKAIITGASSGLGREFAFQLASKGCDIVLVSRSSKKLKEVEKAILAIYTIEVHCLVADLSTLQGVNKLIEDILFLDENISIAINNAGQGLWKKIEDTNPSEINDNIILNYLSVTRLTCFFIDYMKKQKTPSYILNISSTTAYQAVPTMSIYSSTKAALLNFGRACSFELKDSRSHVSLTTIVPGPMTTNFIKSANMDVLQSEASKFEMSVQKVAELSIKAMYDKKTEYIPGVVNRLSRFFGKYFPSYFVEKIISLLYLKKYNKR